MADRAGLLLVLCLVSVSAQGADVFRWVDENGKVHYGDAIPEKYKQQAKKVDGAGGVTGAQRQEAESRPARERARAESLQKARESKTDAPQLAAPPATGDPKPVDQCEEQMRKYLESQDCFAPYVNATGGIKPEAFQRCTEVKQPIGCYPKTGPAERTYLPGAP